MNKWRTVIKNTKTKSVVQFTKRKTDRTNNDRIMGYKKTHQKHSAKVTGPFINK